MMFHVALVFAVLAAVSAMYPGQQCGSMTCPMGYVCRRPFGNSGMYTSPECVYMDFRCPMMSSGGNMWGVKRCGSGGFQQCNMGNGEKCCYNVCVKGPALIPANNWNNGNGMGNGMGNGIYSAAEGGEAGKKPVKPAKKP